MNGYSPQKKDGKHYVSRLDRLVVVTLSRSQTYTSLQQVQQELAPFATKFDTRGIGGSIDFLSTGSVDVRETRASGHSPMNGEWTVEDVVAEGREYRRLIFLSSSNIVQSEASLMDRKGKKEINLDCLTCDHHCLMLAGFALLRQNPLADPENARLKLAVLGLGGGLLASYLVRHFSKASVDGIELDPILVSVAVQWFALPQQNSRLNVQVMDALVYLEQVSKQEHDKKIDVLFVDLAGPTHESGLSGPPAVFLTETVLRIMNGSLKREGVVALNLITRDEEVALKARRAISLHFPSVFRIKSEEDVNEVILACATCIESFDAVQFSRSLRKDIDWVRALEPVIARINPVSLQK